MARNDIKLASGGYGTREFRAEDRNTSVQIQMVSGIPVKGRLGTSNQYCQPIETGEPENGTDIFYGIVHTDSTETATASGVVLVDLVGPGTILEGDATTGANCDTATELNALMGDFVAFDVSATSVYTIDEDQNASNSNVNLCIVGGDTIRTRLFVMCTQGTLVGGSPRNVQT